MAVTRNSIQMRRDESQTLRDLEIYRLNVIRHQVLKLR
jgi:hypothetical protein